MNDQDYAAYKLNQSIKIKEILDKLLAEPNNSDLVELLMILMANCENLDFEEALRTAIRGDDYDY